MNEISGYIIVRKLNDNLYMPVVNPEQKRFSIGKSIIGEFKVLKELNNEFSMPSTYLFSSKAVKFFCKLSIALSFTSL